MSYVKVYSPPSEFDGQVIRDLLADAGIPCIVRTPDALASLTGMSLLTRFESELLVNAEDAERAAELIAGFQGTLGELTEAEEE